MFKIAIVGAGIIGQSHSDAILKNPDCELIAVCDVDEVKAKEMAEVHNAKYYTDYKKMADDIKPDAVILNLPHFLHCEVTVYFLEKGINVLVEKPMANTTEECDKMIEASKKSGAKLAVGHVQKYYSAVREVKKIIESGKYGKLCMITEVRQGDYVTEDRPKWFLNKALAGGGIVMNLGAHCLDRTFYVSDLKAEEVHAITSNPVSEHDIDVDVQMLLKLTGGVSASITLCGNHVPGGYESCYYFTDGVVKIERGVNLCVFEDGKYVNYGGDYDLFSRQIEELVKWLKNEENELVTPEFGREIIRVIEQVV